MLESFHKSELVEILDDSDSRHEHDIFTAVYARWCANIYFAICQIPAHRLFLSRNECVDVGIGGGLKKPFPPNQTPNQFLKKI